MSRRTARRAVEPPLQPNRIEIDAHLFTLFSPAFVHDYRDAWIEIAYGKIKVNTAERFSAFDLQKAADFAEQKNKEGFNIYVGAALRKGETSDDSNGRASKENYLAASHAWAEFDKAEDEARIRAILNEKDLKTGMTIVTGRTPNLRAHLYFKLEGKASSDELENVNTALKTLLNSDAVQDSTRIMRLAGTINYPKPEKVARGYVQELVTLNVRKDAPTYTVERLIGISGDKPGDVTSSSESKSGRTDAEIIKLLELTRVKGEWHNAMLRAIASMVGYGWPDLAIKLSCAPYCVGDYKDADIAKMIRGGRAEFNKADEEEIAPGISSDDTIKRLNKIHAVLPIGGKTRVVTFGASDKFPSHETVVMTQTIGDFVSLNNKHRYAYRDEKGELQKIPLGTYWVSSQKRRQYDGGMAFMPHHDGDVGNRLNLWRGFGVKAIKPSGKNDATAGCQKFLDFMRDIICGGNGDHFDYLRKREATILQKRIRTEVALGLQTDEEGCGKGVYERTMRWLVGTHGMQLSNPKHIVGAFNPHLEPLLRLTADEALFVGNPEHRNALFNLTTEQEMTIEPKNCGIYVADSYLNISVTCNSRHFLPVSNTARRFFIPTVSAARRQDFKYFAELQAELDKGGYEALLYHLLHEVNLEGFNVRDVPRTAGLAQQAAYSRKGVDLLVEIACHEAVAPCQNGALAGVSVCPDDNDNHGYFRHGLDHTIDHNTDRDLARLGKLKVKRQLAKEWGCITGDAARQTVNNVQKSCVIWPPLADLRAKFEKRCGKQDWTHTVTEWLSTNPADQRKPAPSPPKDDQRRPDPTDEDDGPM